MRNCPITAIKDSSRDEKLTEFSGRLAKYRLQDAKLIVHQTVIKELDEATLKKSLLTEILNTNQVTFDSKNKQIQDLQSEVASLREQQSKQADSLKDQQSISEELFAQYPQVIKLAMAKTDEFQPGRAKKLTVLLIHVASKKTLSKEDRRRISAWLKVRTGVGQVKLTTATD